VGTAAVFKLIFSARPSAAVNQLLAFLAWDICVAQRPVASRHCGAVARSPAMVGRPEPGSDCDHDLRHMDVFGFQHVCIWPALATSRVKCTRPPPSTAVAMAQFRTSTSAAFANIYFLTLYSVIGTFKFQSHLCAAHRRALGTTDTASVVIFQTFKRTRATVMHRHWPSCFC